jgi:hypothetical protein
MLAALVSACGGSDGQTQGKPYYDSYRAAQNERNQAESRLRQAFADISAAAQDEDRAGVIAAAMRGQAAAADVDRLLAAQLEAARGLAGISEVAADAKRLTKGLQQTRDSLALVSKELEIALDDPLLARRGGEVRELAKESTDLAVEGELAIRRADHAIAAALGISPRPDQLFTTTG